MTATRPTSEQLRFRSSFTGDHTLDEYLEAAEKGGRTLADLLDDIFDDDGVFGTQIEYRVNASNEFQYRVGSFADPDDGWSSISFFFRQRGAHATATAYTNLDMVTYDNGAYVCTGAHTSSTSAPNLTYFTKVLDGATALEAAADAEAAQVAAEAAQAGAEAARDLAAAYSGSIPYTYSSTTTAADPGSGTIRLNSTTLSSVTTVYIDNNDARGVDVSGWIDSFDNSSNTTIKGLLSLRQANSNLFAIYGVTGTVTNSTGYRTFSVTHLASSGPFTNAAFIGVHFSPAGNDASAASGVTGPATHANAYVPQWSGANSKILQEGRAIGATNATDLIDRAAGDARYQPLTTKLTTWSNLTWAANKLPYFTSASAVATTDFTAFARSLLDDADAAAARNTLGLANVDNTSDVNKPISTATQSALDALDERIDDIEDGETTVYSPAITSNTLTINLALVKGDVKVTVNANINSIVFTNPPTTGRLKSWTLRLVGDGTARTITWPALVKHNGGASPTYNSTSGKTTTFVQFTDDAATTIHSYKSGETG